MTNILKSPSCGLGLKYYQKVALIVLLVELIHYCLPQVGELTQLGNPHHHILGWGRVEPGVRVVLGRLQSGDCTLTREELDGVADLATSSYTVTLSQARLEEQFSWLSPSQATEVVGLACKVQHHTCIADSMHACIMGEQGERKSCSKFFPRPPSILTLVSRLPNLASQEQRSSFLQPLEQLQAKVQDKLRELLEAGQLATTALHVLLHSVDQSVPQHTRDGGLSWGGITAPFGLDLGYVLTRCEEVPGLTREEVERMACWHYSLLFRAYPRVVPRREVSEAYTVNYNPAIILCTLGNHEVEILTSTPGKAICYVTKGGTATTKKIVKLSARELQRRGEEEIADRMEEMVEKEKLRVVTLAEAIYSMNPGLSLSSSNIGRKHVWVGEPEEEDNMDSQEGEEYDEEEDLDVTSDYGLRYV